MPHDFTTIPAIQGSGLSTPLHGQRVNVYGIVTGVTETGFFLQDPIGDGDPTTSDGIFVYSPGSKTTVGRCLNVKGARVDEYYAKTELVAPSTLEPSELCRAAKVVPVPIPYARFGVEASTLYEAYEGMWVTLSTRPQATMLDKGEGPGFVAVVHGPAKRFAGGEIEITVVVEHLHTHIPSGRISPQDTDFATARIFLSNRLGAELPAANWGDRLVNEQAEGLAGILDFAFGKYQFLPFADQVLEHQSSPIKILPAGAATSADFTVCSYNLFGLGRGSEQHADEAIYRAELHRSARSIAEQLQGCTIIALQETGTPADAQELAAYLSVVFGLPYEATALAGPGSNDPIFPLTNSLLTRRDRVTVLEAESGQGCSAVDYDVPLVGNDCPAGEYPLFERLPLLVRVEVKGAWREKVLPLTLINNHWKSKAGDESINLPWRTAQARHVAALAQAELDAGAHLVVLGDLNDFARSEPLEVLRQETSPSLVHASGHTAPAEGYTYIFDGLSQALDHLWLSPSLLPFVAEIRPVHVNAAYAAPVFGSQEPLHSSDHDPIWMRLRPDGAAFLSGNVQYPNIAINLIGPSGKPVATAVSDGLGDYRLWNIAPGLYTVDYQPPPEVKIENPRDEIVLSVGNNVQPAPVVHHDAGRLAVEMAFLLPQLASLLSEEQVSLSVPKRAAIAHSNIACEDAFAIPIDGHPAAYRPVCTGEIIRMHQ